MSGCQSIIVVSVEVSIIQILTYKQLVITTRSCRCSAPDILLSPSLYRLYLDITIFAHVPAHKLTNASPW